MSEARAPVDLVFLWHHHQPDYRSPRDGRAWLPWVRLHATKDYLDMALRLERHPTIRAAFNFVPSLLDQLEAAVAGGSDVLFDRLAGPLDELTHEERVEIARRCGLAPRWAKERWRAYRTACERLGRLRDGASPSDAELIALQCWFLLSWLDPMFYGEPEAIHALSAASTGAFALPDRDGLLALHARLTARVTPAYRALAERGQIELTESAYYHPILPLLVDIASARRSRPDLPLPAEPFAAPEDARAQIERAMKRHEEVFGERPRGMWPPEGSVSPEALELLAGCGVRWVATDEGVLWQSLPAELQRREQLYQPWSFITPAGAVTMLFRDRELSDRVGFVYSRWDPLEAVHDFLQRVRRIGADHAARGGSGGPLVAVILDGENCWENYADDGGPFLEALYAALETATDIRTVTPSDVLAERAAPARLERLHSGSWIDADFHIWCGHPEKNRAWDCVARTRQALVAAGTTPASHPGAWDALFAAEGSDWFWWFGEDHYTADKSLFDRIFREHLQAAHERAGLVAPRLLAMPIGKARDSAASGSAPRGFVRPRLDGLSSSYYEWERAGRIRLGAGGGSMHHGAATRLRELYFGFDESTLYLRFDPLDPAALHGLDLAVELLAPHPVRLEARDLSPGDRPLFQVAAGEVERRVASGRCVVARIVEVAVPFAALGLEPGQSAQLVAHLSGNGVHLESVPADQVVRFTVPDDGFESRMWSV